jgi:hypothetical protein
LDLTLQYEDELQLQQEARKVAFPPCTHCSLFSVILFNISFIKATVKVAKKADIPGHFLFDSEGFLANKL